MKESKILIVEDEFIFARDLEWEIKSMGYEVIGIVKTGEEAIERVETENPDLVIMDINLAGKIDGIETCTQIRNKHNNTSIVYITAYNDCNTLKRAIGTNPDNFLCKPIKEEVLESTIETIIFKSDLLKKTKYAS